MTTGEDRPQRRSWRALVLEFLRFLGSSGVGLATDLALFQLLVWAGLPPWGANAISASTAITVVYVLAARFAFGQDTRLSTYVLFFGWYAASVAITSVVIELLSTATGVTPFLWKLATVPVTFGANYLFSRFLFRPRGAGSASAPSAGA
ncbi:hypothetical protein BH09ACT5_BH09ACT5_14100 [soil metagenome]